MGINPSTGLYELATGQVTPADVIAPARDGLDVLAGGQGLALLKREFARAEYAGEKQLSAALDGITEQYDYVILDTSPGWDTLAVLEGLAVRGLIDYADRINRVGQDSGVHRHRVRLSSV